MSRSWTMESEQSTLFEFEPVVLEFEPVEFDFDPVEVAHVWSDTTD